MIQIVYYALGLLAGAGGGVQASMNAALGRIVGVTEATLVSVTGTWLSVVLLLIVGFRSGNMGQVTSTPPYLLIGGLFGAMILLTATRSVPIIGVAAFSSALIVGQLVSSVVLDQMGAFGHASHPLDAGRVLGIAFLLVGLKLVLR